MVGELERCIFCGSIEEVLLERCDKCWHEMCLDPEAFLARMASLGIKVVEQNPHVGIVIDGQPAIGSRDPFILKENHCPLKNNYQTPPRTSK